MKKWLCSVLAVVLLFTSSLAAFASESIEVNEGIPMVNSSADVDSQADGDVEVDTVVDGSFETPINNESASIEAVTGIEGSDENNEENQNEQPLNDEKPSATEQQPAGFVYARIVSGGTPVFEDASLQKKLLELAAGDVVLVVGIVDGTASIALDSGSKASDIVEGYVANSALEAIEEDALKALFDGLAESGKYSLYQGKPEYMLPRLSCNNGETSFTQDASETNVEGEDETEEPPVDVVQPVDEEQEEDPSETKEAEDKSGNKDEDKTETKEENESENKEEDKSENKEENESENKEENESETKEEIKSENKEEDKSETKEEQSETKEEEKSETKEEEQSETREEDSETKKGESEPQEGEEENGEGESEEEAEGVEMAQANVALTGIALSYGSMSIGLKETCRALVVRPIPAEASLEGLTFTWTSKKPKIVTVNGQGVIYGKKKGTSVITVTASNGMIARCKVKVTKAPKSIAISPASVSLYTNSAPYRLPRPTAKKGACATYTYASSNNGVATVSPDGVVTPVGKGWTNISIRSYNGKWTSFRVNVYGVPAGIRFNQESVNVCTGMRVSPGVTIVDNEGDWTPGSPTYTIADSQGSDGDASCVSIAGDGRSIGGVQKGKTYVFAHFEGFVTDVTCAVNVLKAPKTFAFSNGRTTLGKGETIGMGPIMINEDNEQVSGTFSVKSSKPKVVSVTAGGVIKGKKKGKAVITYTAFNGVRVTRTITVVNAPKKATVSPGSVVLGVGQSATLRVNLKKGTAGACSFSSNNNGIATVNGNGTVTAVQPGTAKINIRSYNGKAKCTATVYVVSGPVYVRLTNVDTSVEDDGSGRYTLTYRHTMQVGSKYTLSAMVEYPAPGSVAGYSSENPDIATVTNSGEITALQPGIATIVARATNGAEAKCTLYVQGTDEAESGETVVETYDPEYAPGEDDISIEFVGIKNYVKTMTIGDQYHPALVNDQGDLVDSAVLTSSDSGVAKVEGDKIVAEGTGTAIITATYKSASATLQINVTGPISQIVLSPAEYQGRKNNTVQLSATFASSLEHGSITYSSDDESVATVTDKGLVTLVSAGVAEITATSVADSSVKSAAVTITVLEDPLNYRLFTAYSYDSTAYSGSGKLPFTRNNTEGVAKVFVENSGLNYTHSGNLRNPSKQALLNGLQSFANNGGPNDVSLIFLCSHGHVNYGGISGYSLSLSGTSDLISSNELLNAISGGSSRVVLILDSCYSGYFLDDVYSRLTNELNGRISVMTASNNTRASYYNVANTSQAVDFFTCYLLLGTGYDISNHFFVSSDKRAKGSAPGYMLADATQNHSAKDGVITVSELFDYGLNGVRVNVPGFTRKSWFWGDKNQTPRYYAGNNGNLAIFRP